MWHDLRPHFGQLSSPSTRVARRSGRSHRAGEREGRFGREGRIGRGAGWAGRDGWGRVRGWAWAAGLGLVGLGVGWGGWLAREGGAGFGQVRKGSGRESTGSRATGREYRVLD